MALREKSVSKLNINDIKVLIYFSSTKSNHNTTWPESY